MALWSLLGGGLAVRAAGPGADDHLPNSGQMSDARGVTPTMLNNAVMACTASADVLSISGAFTLSGVGPAGASVLIFLSPNNGSDATPAGNVENNEVRVDIAGRNGTVPFTLTISSPFSTSKGGVLAVFARDVNGAIYSSKSNSLNCMEFPIVPQPTPTDVAPQPTPTEAIVVPTPTDFVPQPTPTDFVPTPTDFVPQPTPTEAIVVPTPTDVVDTVQRPGPIGWLSQPTPTGEVLTEVGAPRRQTSEVPAVAQVTPPETSTAPASVPGEGRQSLILVLVGLSLLVVASILLTPVRGRTAR